MPVVTDVQTISETITDIIDFIKIDKKVKNDFDEYLKTINGINLSSAKLQAASIPYITERIIYELGKTVPEIYLEEKKDLSELQKEIVNGLNHSISSIFEVKKVLRNGFILYNFVNEKTYTVIPLVKMTNLRDVLTGQFALIRIFEFQGTYYMLEISDLIPSYEKEQVINFAVAKMIEQPETVYLDNEEKFDEVKNYVKSAAKKFLEFFNTDEIITTNRKIDELVDIFNNFQQTNLIPEKFNLTDYIDTPSTLKYFKVSEFESSYDSFVKNSMNGFSSHSETYDVGYICDDLGIYIIPFWKTLCEIFSSDKYKEIENYVDCVKNFIANDKIPPSFIERLSTKAKTPADFETRLSEILGEKTTLDKTIKKYKSEYLKKTIFSSSSVLYCSKTFAQLLETQN